MATLAQQVKAVAHSYVRPALNGEMLPTFDDEHQSYAVFAVGDIAGKHYHHVVLHVRVLNDKVIIEDHNTNADLIADLIAGGIPPDKIEQRAKAS
jgi:hypothetical protein